MPEEKAVPSVEAGMAAVEALVAVEADMAEGEAVVASEEGFVVWVGYLLASVAKVAVASDRVAWY